MLIFSLVESLVVPECCRAIEGVYISSCIGFFFLEVSLELDSRLLGEDLYRFTEVDLLYLHEEF